MAVPTEIEYYDLLPYVNPLIGTSNGGNVFPGATLPYGMAKAVADTNSTRNQSGFILDGSAVTGFSMMHDSGTGGSPNLGNFALFPFTSCPDRDVNNCVFPKKARAGFGGFDKESVTAKPGLFGLSLDSGIRVDMTTTQHTSLFKFSFPPVGSDGEESQPLILQDLTDLSDSRHDNASVFVEQTTGRITRSAPFSPGFGSGIYILYFCTDFKGPQVKNTGTFVNSRASSKIKNFTVARGINQHPLPGGAFVQFASGEEAILARTATSFISAERACSYAKAEIPDFDFSDVYKAAVRSWREKLSLVRVSTESVNESTLTNFHSGIYRTMINPQNYTGENPLWESGEPYYDSFYYIWDIFRSQLPLLTILDPVALTGMIRSLIDTYRHMGWLPDCRMSLSKGFTQGGSNADVVLADAYLKDIQDGINWEDGFAAVVKDAEDFDHKGTGTMTRSISRTLEYAYDDFCIAQMAAKMNKTAEQQRYLASRNNWQNLFKPNQTSHWWNGTDTGFTGFFEPRFLNKTWGYQDPLNCSNLDDHTGCSLTATGGETYESSIWEYSFYVPHDQGTLISLLGGPSTFTSRLDYLHDRNITYIGNEPAFLTVFQYHFAGRPCLSSRRAHAYIPSTFSPTPGGLPGNDDSGAMGSFLAFAMMGMFPVPGQDVYLVTAPFFREVEVTSVLTGRTARVRSVMEEGEGEWREGEVYCVRRAEMDGEAWGRSCVDHGFWTEGRELVLWLGREEGAWGTGVRDLPPSTRARSYNSITAPNTASNNPPPGATPATANPVDVAVSTGLVGATVGTTGACVVVATVAVFWAAQNVAKEAIAG
ncbi:glycoside hydrolase family 92 protein [Schizothecium vesticola]|uniref:Glycoside hydrolase family 92 protein n=1 Tax=Schizothecium vesticola TaxID=314040 RepID=A0AA40F4R1_9PEZI|nr:glycoside hydrolase family 92 protein [Schizothecium vesticola]